MIPYNFSMTALSVNKMYGLLSISFLGSQSNILLVQEGRHVGICKHSAMAHWV